MMASESPAALLPAPGVVTASADEETGGGATPDRDSSPAAALLARGKERGQSPVPRSTGRCCPPSPAPLTPGTRRRHCPSLASPSWRTMGRLRRSDGSSGDAPTHPPGRGRGPAEAEAPLVGARDAQPGRTLTAFPVRSGRQRAKRMRFLRPARRARSGALPSPSLPPLDVPRVRSRHRTPGLRKPAECLARIRFSGARRCSPPPACGNMQ